MAGIFITGTDTDVGKTVATAYVVQVLREAGIDAVGYKPIQTGIATDHPDVEFYQKVAGTEATAPTTYTYNEPCSPHLAAKQEQSSICLDEILKQVEMVEKKHKYVVIEGAGGLVVPLNTSGMTLTTLVQKLGFAVLVVAKSKVGVLNHAALTIHYAKSKGIKVAGMLLNECSVKPDFVEKDNIKMLQEMNQVPIVSMIPKLEEPLADNVRKYSKMSSTDSLLKACEVERDAKRNAYSKK
ncbi:dethiobiotin synthase [Alkalihalophilus lindianensis]|uniref:ATP-dependent dethiobiotin synthetase BioD n=1 Tax=Alkalihalophilus lindianensis TaxID=1630542 RepID=A0ABU3XFH3_9BACI|nr:dethiobiotin synthase [Alkalihalophilus lindianensis]MDV2686357.1 dethiobiotin synthase [Alkalihalophilus lindianensis]